MRSFDYLNIVSSDLVQNIECVSGGIFNGGVSSRGGDPEQCEIFGVCGHDDGEHVVVAGVAVEPNLYHDILKTFKVMRMGIYIVGYDGRGPGGAESAPRSHAHDIQ